MQDKDEEQQDIRKLIGNPKILFVLGKYPNAPVDSNSTLSQL